MENEPEARGATEWLMDVEMRVSYLEMKMPNSLNC